ncbi:UNVERIFIED_CONTAM: hypothetical protein FKN15_057761 [Acipenser sinensis]
MDRNALAELLQALESRRDAEERRREERYTALIERYDMVFDAGLTHTSLLVYKENGMGLVTQDSEPCVDEQVLMEVGKVIGSYPFKFQGARILSGVEEGHTAGSPSTTCSAPSSRFFQSPCPTKPEPYLPDSRVMFTGSGSPAQCESLIKTLFNCSACAGKPECSFDGVYQPSVRGNFLAFSAFFYTFDFLKLAPQSSLDVTKKTTEEFCKRDWSSVDDTDIGWMLGYTLNLTNLIPTETPAR